MNYVITKQQLQIILEDIEPSKTAIKNICDSEKFCNTQGKITFGQLKAIVDSATKNRIFKHVGEGGIKATMRVLPWFLPQLMIPSIIAGTVRVINKIIRPSLTETENYKTFWGKAVLKSFKIAEGEVNLTDPFSKIFFISDGLMTMMDDKYKVKFAKYIADIASKMPDDEEVPEYFVENELRRWINDKFLLNPPLSMKIEKIEESRLEDLVKSSLKRHVKDESRDISGGMFNYNGNNIKYTIHKRNNEAVYVYFIFKGESKKVYLMSDESFIRLDKKGQENSVEDRIKKYLDKK